MSLKIGEIKVIEKYMEIKGINRNVYSFIEENNIINVREFIEQNSTYLELIKVQKFTSALDLDIW